MKKWFGAVVLIVSLLSCDNSLPTESAPSVEPVTSFADAVLLPIDDPPPDFVDIDTIDLVTPPPGEGVSEEVDLGVVTAASGAIAVQIEGSFALDSVPIPIGEIINGGGMLYWEQALITFLAPKVPSGSALRNRGSAGLPQPFAVPPPRPGYGTSIEQKGVRFEFTLVSDSAGEEIERDVIPELVSPSSNSVRLLLDSTARGRLKLRWSINQNGGAYLPEDHPDECLPIHERCTPFPPVSRLWIVDFFEDVPKASGSGRIIVQRREGAVVEFSVSRDSVLPVFAQRFDGVSQVTSGTAAARRDTVVVTIPGVSSASSPERRVRLFSVPVNRSGGHFHNGDSVLPRPKGTFFRLNQLGSISTGGAGSRDTITIVRPVGTDTSIVYRTSGIGGVEWIRMRAVGGGSPRDLDSIAITVKLAGMDSTVDASQNYHFAGSSNHRFHDRFAQPGVIQVLDSIWGEWKGKPVNQRHLYPMTNRGQGFAIHAMSLPNGGMHDIKGRWAQTGHQYHREGLDVDFNDLAAESADTLPGQRQSPRDRMVSLCAERRYQIAGQRFAVDCDPHFNDNTKTTIHYHVYLVPIGRRNALLPWRQ